MRPCARMAAVSKLTVRLRSAGAGWDEARACANAQLGVNALLNPHSGAEGAGGGEALRVVRDERARVVAAAVVGRIVAVDLRLAPKVAQVAGGEWCHAEARFVHEEADEGLLVLDGE